MANSKIKTRYHYTCGYLLNPQHRVTVDLVGLGGTGSQVLTMLGRMSSSLVALGHPGLYVRAWDPDVISQANIGRQLFSEAEVGQFKANCLTTRVNRFFGTDWEAYTTLYNAETLASFDRPVSNITITCVDTIAARLSIGEHLKDLPVFEQTRTRLVQDDKAPFYWLDFGNAQKTGQVVLGTVQEIAQPDKLPKDQVGVKDLKDVLKMFPSLAEQKEEESGPSCSLAEALEKQDLFINSTLCNLGMTIFWKLFKEMRITYNGAFLNLDTLSTNPIKI